MWLIARGFHRTFAMGAAWQRRTLSPPDTWSCPSLGLACVLMLTLISRTCLVSRLLSFEHPSVLLFCFEFSYCVRPYSLSSLYIHPKAVSLAFMVGATSQAGKVYFSHAPGLISLTWTPKRRPLKCSRAEKVSVSFSKIKHLFPLRVELVVQFPARGSSHVLLCLFPGMLWLWHFLYSVGPYPVPRLHIYTFVVSRAFMTGAASQAGDADSSRAPVLTSGLQGSLNFHRCALLLVPQWRCISSFVFYILHKSPSSRIPGIYCWLWKVNKM